MLEAGLAYLRREMARGGLWHYWNRDAMGEGRRIYQFIPADLDDTASHSWLLRRHGVDFPENRSLLHHNRDHRGCFYTWGLRRLRASSGLRYWNRVMRGVAFERMTRFWRTTEPAYNDVDAAENNPCIQLHDR